MLAVVVIARDEADRIAACLRSVPWAIERIVLDSGSKDDTVAIAEAEGARVIRTDWPGHVAQKNRALTHATADWVLSLDADERLSPDAGQQLREALANPGDAHGFSFARRSNWLGTPLRHGRWYPDRKVRVVRRGMGEWVGDDPHDRLSVAGPVVDLDADILHEPYRDLSEHLGTIDRYSKISAERMAAQGRRARALDVVSRPILHFVNAYLFRGGFRDGVPGFAVAGLGASYVLCKWYRLWALEPARTAAAP